MRVTSILVVTLVAATAQAQSGVFVVRKGNDTVLVERFTRDGAQLRGEIQQGTGLHTQYVMTLRADGWVDHVEMTRVGRQGNGVRLSLDFESSIAHVFMMRGAEVDTLHVLGATHPQPFLAVSLALSEQLVRAARLAPGQHVAFTAVRLGAADTVPLVLTRFHADSVSLVMPDVALRLALSRDGEVVGGTHSLQPWVIARRPAADHRGGGSRPAGLP